MKQSPKRGVGVLQNLDFEICLPKIFTPKLEQNVNNHSYTTALIRFTTWPLIHEFTLQICSQMTPNLVPKRPYGVAQQLVFSCDVNYCTLWSQKLRESLRFYVVADRKVNTSIHMIHASPFCIRKIKLSFHGLLSAKFLCINYTTFSCFSAYT